MTDNTELSSLIEQDEYKWVKDDLLPLFGLLDIVDEASNGFFMLPRSKENLILNLQRMTRLHKSILEKRLDSFEFAFEKDAPSDSDSFEFHTDSGTTRKHPPSRTPCPWPIQATKFYTISPRMAVLSRRAIESLEYDAGPIISSILSRVTTIEDLLYLYILRQTAQKSRGNYHYPFDDEKGGHLREIMEIAEIDDEVISFLLATDPRKQFGYDGFNRLLPNDERQYATFYSHDFNTSSCIRKMNVKLNPELAKSLISALKDVPFESLLRSAYDDVTAGIKKKKNRLPLFTSKDHRYGFLENYLDLIVKDYKALYNFEIEDEGHLKALRFLKRKNLVKVSNGKVLPHPEGGAEKLLNLHRHLESEEQERIERNKKEIVLRWLRSRIPPLEGADIATPSAPEAIAHSPPREVPVPEEVPAPPMAPEITAPPEPPVMPEVAAATSSLKVFLGPSDRNEPVHWEPGRLNNGHFIIVGGSGAGKTETIRCLAAELDQQDYPVLMIDFHGDMATETGRLRTFKVQEDSETYFNPLELDPEFDEITPLRASSDFVDAIIINVPGMGVQQKGNLKDIIRNAFDTTGITSDRSTWSKAVPFKEIERAISSSDDKDVQKLKAYLRDVFDYDLFHGSEKISIGEIIHGGITHINLRPLPEPLRSLYADLLLRRLYYSLQAQGEIARGDISDKERFLIFVIVDEAKLLVTQKDNIKAVLNKFATEMRKYGVGLILASQLIEHFNDEILSNISVKLCMKAENKKQAQKNSGFFGVKVSELLAIDRGAGILLATKKNKVSVVPSWERK